MEYEFYVDVCFLNGWFLNLQVLFLTAAILRQEIISWRMGLAAALGSIWNIVLVLVPFVSNEIGLFLTIVPVGAWLIYITFPNLPSHFHRISALGALLVASAMVGGMLTFAVKRCFLNGWEGLVFSGLMCLLGERLLRYARQRSVGEIRCLVRLYYRGRCKEFKALVDSGNRLRVPGTGAPVSLISYRDCVGLCDTVDGGFFIPYHAVGTEKGMLFAVVFEKMEIIEGKKVRTIDHPAVAIVKEALSVSGEFSIILPEAYIPE